MSDVQKDGLQMLIESAALRIIEEKVREATAASLEALVAEQTTPERLGGLVQMLLNNEIHDAIKRAGSTTDAHGRMRSIIDSEVDSAIRNHAQPRIRELVLGMFAPKAAK